jgi:hypothetical protein
MGILTNGDKGRFNILFEHGKDHDHVMSLPAEVVQPDDEGSRKQDGMDFPTTTTFGVGVIVRLLTLIMEEAKDQEPTVARKYYKVGAAVATALCGSLRGSEVFMLELAALWRHIKIGCNGTLPPDPMSRHRPIHCPPHHHNVTGGVQR